MEDLIEISCCNEEILTPINGNILGGTFAYISKKNPTLERKNQDSLGLFANSTQAVFIVADGIGGHRMGDEASKIAVEAILSELRTQPTITSDLIYAAILKANQQIRSLNVGAGTTLCLCFINNGILTFYNIGDSRGIHLSGKGNIKTETMDHSSAGLAAKSDLFKKEEILAKENGNHLLYALGDEILNISVIGPIEINQRDNVLLSSDGLTANLSSDEVCLQITQGLLTDRVQSLLNSIDKKIESGLGHPDDLSILLFSFGRSDTTESSESEEKKV